MVTNSLFLKWFNVSDVRRIDEHSSRLILYSLVQSRNLVTWHMLFYAYHMHQRSSTEILSNICQLSRKCIQILMISSRFELFLIIALGIVRLRYLIIIILYLLQSTAKLSYASLIASHSDRFYSFSNQVLQLNCVCRCVRIFCLLSLMQG